MARYADDKPKECKYCYWYENKKVGCILGEEKCYYLLPDKKEESPKCKCDGCTFSRPNPCIGYCIKEIHYKVRKERKIVRKKA